MTPEEAERVQDAPLNSYARADCRASSKATGDARWRAAADRVVEHGSAWAKRQRRSYIIASGTDITERKRLEKAVLEISAREQRRIGQDLHDGLGQHLTGIAFMRKVLERRLAEKSLAEAADAAKIVRLVNEAIEKTRDLSRGLLPVVADARGLMSALEHWAVKCEDLFHVACRFECDDRCSIQDDAIATHLYHIAQEAVNNAIKHGRAKTLDRALRGTGRRYAEYQDDGVGFRAHSENQPGHGTAHHELPRQDDRRNARVQSWPRCGTMVTCLFPSGASCRNTDATLNRTPTCGGKSSRLYGGRSSHCAAGTRAADQPGAGSGGLRRGRRSALRRCRRSRQLRARHRGHGYLAQWTGRPGSAEDHPPRDPNLPVLILSMHRRIALRRAGAAGREPTATS